MIDSFTGEVAPLLRGSQNSYSDEAEKLFPQVYEQLKQLARQRMAGEREGHTFQATALVHEAYLRLAAAGNKWSNRAHFFFAAAEAMRRILIDRARHKRSLKAGGERQRQELPDIEAPSAEPEVDVLALDEALQKLEKQDERKAKLVKLRFFARLTIEQAAQVLGIATSTAQNDWAYARYWLRLKIEESLLDGSS